MSSTEQTTVPDSADHRDETEDNQPVREGDHIKAAEAARRQARQDPLQG